MNRQKEDMDFLIRKIITIGLFLFIFFIFKSTDCSNIESFNKSVAIEHVLTIDNSAILVKPISFPNLQNLLVSCDLFTFNNSNKENFKIICSNIKTNHLLRLCKERFIEIKPQIIDLNSYHIRASLNNEVISLIS
jgi:hypothetical protein